MSRYYSKKTIFNLYINKEVLRNMKYKLHVKGLYEFSFSLTGCLIKVNEHSLPIAGRWGSR